MHFNKKLHDIHISNYHTIPQICTITIVNEKRLLFWLMEQQENQTTKTPLKYIPHFRHYHF